MYFYADENVGLGPKLSKEKIPRNVLHLIAHAESNWFGILAAFADADLFWLGIFGECFFFSSNHRT